MVPLLRFVQSKKAIFTIARKRLAFKILLFAIPFLLVSIILTGLALSLINYRYFLKTIDLDYDNIVKGATGEIRLYMDSAFKGLEGLSYIVSSTKPSTWQRELTLAAFNHMHPEYMAIVHMDLTGEYLTVSGVEECKLEFGESELIAKALTGRRAVSFVQITRENVPYTHIAVPILYLGDIVGVVMAELNLKSVWDVLESVRVGQTGEIYIMDLEGRLIGNRDMEPVLGILPQVPPDVLVEIRDSFEPMEWTEMKNGIKYYCLGCLIPQLDWVVVLTQKEYEIRSYLYRSTNLGMFIVVVISILAVVLGWKRTDSFLAPVREMHSQVRKIGEGDLDQKVTVMSEDEVGDLGRAFNEMAESLKKFVNREVESAKDLVQAKSLAMLGLTSSKVTHEVDNLLNNISGTIQILQKEGLSDQGRMALEILAKESVRIRSFISNFLQYAKRPELQLTRTSLESGIREAAYVQKAVAREKGIKIDVKWPAGLPPVNVDTRQFYQVITNLIKNAVEALDQPGSVIIEGSTEGEHLYVAISDTGPGVQPEQMDKIFEPFFTTKGKKGTGLGLATCRSIMEAHRGDIMCESEVGKGATFIVKLPLV